MSPNRILIIEDSRDQQLLLTQLLGRKHEVACVSSVAAAKAELNKHLFDLIVLDVNLPDQDGFAFCAEMRQDERLKSIPVVFLTGRVAPTDKVHGFTVGGDDYVTKPFDVLEFSARIDARLRRRNEAVQVTEAFVQGFFRVDHAKQRIALMTPEGDLSLDLTTNEYKILHYFICHEDHLLSRSQILDQVWGTDVHVTDRTVDSHIYTLRKKLGRAAHFIETVPRAGYRFLQGALAKESAS